MILRISGDRSFTVYVTFEFYDVKRLWRNFLKIEDRVDVENHDGDITAYVDFAVIGRRPADVSKITLEYDGHTVVLLPGEDKFENVSPIILYEGGRDFWTNQLRRNALES